MRIVVICNESELMPAYFILQGISPWIATGRTGLRPWWPMWAQRDGVRSLNCELDTRVALAGQKNVSYIIKWNPRREDQLEWAGRIFFKGGNLTTPLYGKRVGLLTVYIQQVHMVKTYRFKRVMRAVERTTDRHGQRLLRPEVEVEGWWTTLDPPKKDVIGLCEDRDTSEQFHAEIKSDMDMERLPSGKFATNALILTLGGLAHNILPAIGQLPLVSGQTPVRHLAKPRRIKTVMHEPMCLAARLVRTGRRPKLVFSRHCPAFEAFRTVYTHFACG